MVKKIIISHFNNIAAVLVNNKIQEIIIINNTYQVNDIYIGVVHKIFTSINAAFIKLGKNGKSGFIHVSDMKPLKRGKVKSNINEILAINQLILVQVIKEPTINKGPRLTANIHLYGKYIILMPLCNSVSISQKIYDDNERMYLFSLAILIKPQNMGILVKSSSQGVTEKAILQDLDFLRQQWNFIKKTMILYSNPNILYKDEDLIKKIIRDFYEESINKVVIDSEDGLRRLYYFLYKWYCISPITNLKLQLYKHSECILNKFYIKQTIKNSLKSKVNLFFGGYLVIENHEALNIIDVNSGSFNQSDNSKEAILKTNFYAAIEIAYQLRMRNLNGVIIVDFIDMHSQRDQLQLLDHFSKLLEYDNAKPQIVQLSELGLVELTRRRRGQSLKEIFNKTNESCYIIHGMSMNLYLDLYNRNLKHSILVNRNIKSLFFSKTFAKNINLNCKKYIYSHQLASQVDLITLDLINKVRFFKVRAHYFVPLLFYLKLVNSR
uniref:Ribonuclease E n=1 Tax=Callithamnion tetricum TaxID=193179 RepID=A0A4D6WQU9_9FLOR|nr:ribonuclease E [Callithamnion tetricum]